MWKGACLFTQFCVVYMSLHETSYAEHPVVMLHSTLGPKDFNVGSLKTLSMGPTMDMFLREQQCHTCRKSYDEMEHYRMGYDEKTES